MSCTTRLRILHPNRVICQGASPSPSPAPVPPPSGGKIAVQLIFHTTTGLLVVDGSGDYTSEGSLEITTSPFNPPPPGTVVQIVIDGPGGTSITEGTTGGVGGDGSLNIL